MKDNWITVASFLKRAQTHIEAAKIVNLDAANAVEQASVDMDPKHNEDPTAGKNVPKPNRRLTAGKVFKVDRKVPIRTAEKGMDLAWYAYSFVMPELYPHYWKVS